MDCKVKEPESTDSVEVSLSCDDSGEAGALSLSKYNVKTGARSTGGETLGDERPG